MNQITSRVNLIPIDLGDLKMYDKLHTLGIQSNKGRKWTFQWKGNYEPTQVHINETFTIKPVTSDIGRKYSHRGGP